jgi:hypothetical protein
VDPDEPELDPLEEPETPELDPEEALPDELTPDELSPEEPELEDVEAPASPSSPPALCVVPPPSGAGAVVLTGSSPGPPAAHPTGSMNTTARMAARLPRFMGEQAAPRVGRRNDGCVTNCV